MQKPALLTLLLLSLSVSALAQTSDQAESVRVFLDCSFFCEDQFIRDELPIVDFVTEPSLADVHILYATQSTGSGGERVTLTLIGQRRFSALADTLVYSTSGDATSDDRRNALRQHLAIGLARYLARAGLADLLQITAVRSKEEDQGTTSVQSDPWNYWAFSVGGNGSMDGQASTSSQRRSVNVSANRTTEELKIRIRGNASASRNEFDTGDGIIVSRTNSESFSTQIVRSIGSQWAAGATGTISTSSFQNTKLQMAIGPAVEYNFFPYSESTRKYLTLQYRMELARRQYDQLTIFALEEESILSHALELSLSLAQKWGSLSISTEMEHLISNFDRSLLDSYNLGIFGNASVRLFRGLSFNTFASYNRIRDQLDLPGDAATKEEILLRSVQLPTGYSYFVNFGFTYRFGSIYNNVVNPRMGGGGGGGFVIFG